MDESFMWWKLYDVNRVNEEEKISALNFLGDFSDKFYVNCEEVITRATSVKSCCFERLFVWNSIWLHWMIQLINVYSIPTRLTLMLFDARRFALVTWRDKKVIHDMNQ
jgi:hypothetical protein